MRTLKTAVVMVLFLNMCTLCAEDMVKGKTVCYDQSEIAMAYKTADIPADAMYKNRTITVKGTVKSIKQCRNENAIYLYDRENDFYIKCCFENNEEIKTEDGIFCGDRIIITGECKGKKHDIIIKKCVVNKVIYNPVWCLGLF